MPAFNSNNMRSGSTCQCSPSHEHSHVRGTSLPCALRCRQGFGHVVPILGRVMDSLQATGKDTPVNMAALLKREAMDVIGEACLLVIQQEWVMWGAFRTVQVNALKRRLICCSCRPGGLWV